MGWTEFPKWLRANLLRGVHLILANPKPHNQRGLALPLFRFLVDVENGDFGTVGDLAVNPVNERGSNGEGGGNSKPGEVG
jgi:hypothetical protein